MYVNKKGPKGIPSLQSTQPNPKTPQKDTRKTPPKRPNQIPKRAQKEKKVEKESTQHPPKKPFKNLPTNRLRALTIFNKVFKKKDQEDRSRLQRIHRWLRVNPVFFFGSCVFILRFSSPLHLSCSFRSPSCLVVRRVESPGPSRVMK